MVRNVSNVMGTYIDSDHVHAFDDHCLLGSFNTDKQIMDLLVSLENSRRCSVAISVTENGLIEVN